MISSLQAWIDHIFNHSIAERAFNHSIAERTWYWSDDAEEWTGPREEIPVLIAATFEHSGERLSEFSDEQLARGFWHLLYAGRPECMQTLADESLPAALRLRALKSFVPLFEQVMALRCTDELCHLDEEVASLLNGPCYMWWEPLRDIPLTGSTLFNAEIIAILRLILAIPHDACRESALHGIGYLRRDRPELHRQFSGIIDDFLAQTPNLRPELLTYAEYARQGNVR